MLTFIVYSHSSYADILQIQNDYLRDVPGHKILWTDKEDFLKDSVFDRVILYDDTMNYTKRIYHCLRTMCMDGTMPELALFLHDNDIILSIDLEKIEELMGVMQTHMIDRIDLKWTEPREEQSIAYGDQYRLIRNRNPYNYVYNVNPSIWRLRCLGAMCENFDLNYRMVERFVQMYCAQTQNVYFLSGSKKHECGYYRANSLLVFLHVSHGGKLLPKIDNGLDADIMAEYQKIIDKYPFQREFREKRW